MVRRGPILVLHTSREQATLRVGTYVETLQTALSAFFGFT